MNVVFWVLMVILVLSFLVSMFSCLGVEGDKSRKREELLKAVVILALMVLLNKYWR